MVELMHGDCLDLLRGIGSESVDSVITDPPYGVSYQSAWRTDVSARKEKIANDDHPFIWWLFDAFRVTKIGGCLVCFFEWRHQEVFRMAIQAAGYTVKSQVIWDRDWHGMGDLKAAFAPQHDVIWFAVKGKGFAFQNGRPHSVVRFRRVAADALIHPTEKPIALMEYLVDKVTEAGGLVLDPFAGSGSAGAACVNTGRNFIGIEKDDKYFAIASERIANAERAKAA